jgi:hypothetical protein
MDEGAVALAREEGRKEGARAMLRYVYQQAQRKNILAVVIAWAGGSKDEELHIENAIKEFLS